MYIILPVGKCLLLASPSFSSHLWPLPVPYQLIVDTTSGLSPPPSTLLTIQYTYIVLYLLYVYNYIDIQYVLYWHVLIHVSIQYMYMYIVLFSLYCPCTIIMIACVHVHVANMCSILKSTCTIINLWDKRVHVHVCSEHVTKFTYTQTILGGGGAL